MDLFKVITARPASGGDTQNQPGLLFMTDTGSTYRFQSDPDKATRFFEDEAQDWLPALQDQAVDGVVYAIEDAPTRTGDLEQNSLCP